MRYFRQDQDRQWLWGKAWGPTLDGVVTIASKRWRGFRMWWHTHNGSWVHMDSRYIKLFMNIINRFCTHRCTLRNAIRTVSPPTHQNKIEKITILKIYRVSVRLGEHQLSTEMDCRTTGRRRKCTPPVEDLGFVGIYKHEEFLPHKGAYNDIALIQLARSVEFKR